MIRKDLLKIFIDEIYNKASLRNYPTTKLVFIHIDETWSIDLAVFFEL